MPERIYIVIGGQFVLGVYRAADSAELHRRCVTGARVVQSEILESVAPEILDDIMHEFDADQDDDTPVTAVNFDDIESGEDP